MTQAKEITLMDNIQEMYKQIDRKNDLFTAIAKEFKMSPISIKTNWFSSLWAIPEDKQTKVIEIMQKSILEQNSKKSA